MEDEQDKISDTNGGDSSVGELPAGIIPKTSTGKRGRPLGSKNGQAGIDTGVPKERRSKNSPTPDALESAKFIGTGFVALIELAESFVHSSCVSKIQKKLPSKLHEFKEMADKICLQEKEKETMSACVEKIALKHDWLTRFGPEVVLGVMLSQYSLRQISLMRFVDNVTKEKKPEQVAAPITEKVA